jgi:hypothetical protein
MMLPWGPGLQASELGLLPASQLRAATQAIRKKTNHRSCARKR